MHSNSKRRLKYLLPMGEKTFLSVAKVPIRIDKNHTVIALLKVVYVPYLKVNKKIRKVALNKQF
jgi:hypothetical protein